MVITRFPQTQDAPPVARIGSGRGRMENEMSDAVYFKLTKAQVKKLSRLFLGVEAANRIGEPVGVLAQIICDSKGNAIAKAELFTGKKAVKIQRATGEVGKYVTHDDYSEAAK